MPVSIIFKEVKKILRRGLKDFQQFFKGFTLIEVVVSLAIIGISIVTILQLFSGGLRSIKISDDYLRASILAQNKMKELESRSSIFINQEGVFEQDDRYNWSLAVENYDFTGLHPQFENLKEGNIENPIFVDKVRLKVFWNTSHGQREMELVTLKASTRVSPSSKDILLGNYPRSLLLSRGEQFGEQELPSGQSEKQHVKVNVCGTGKSRVEKAFVCGAPSDFEGEISGNKMMLF